VFSGIEGAGARYCAVIAKMELLLWQLKWAQGSTEEVGGGGGSCKVPFRCFCESTAAPKNAFTTENRFRRPLTDCQRSACRSFHLDTLLCPVIIGCVLCVK
jgi:hypothetical protein